jgi:hypothetical protein
LRSRWNRHDVIQRLARYRASHPAGADGGHAGECASHCGIAGSGDFSPLWAGQNVSGCKAVPAGILTRELAR